MKLSELDKDERSLLLFLETCAVDHGGLVDARKMSASDTAIAARWTEIDFVIFKRLCAKDAEELSHSGKEYTKAVILSNEAFDLAHQERRARAERINKSRSWKTTDEIRTEQPVKKSRKVKVR